MMSPQVPPASAAPADLPTDLPTGSLAVVERYFDALTGHDHEVLGRLIATEGFCYESPIATIDDTPAFLEYIMMTGGILRGIKRRRVFVDGADVCHWLVLDTQLSERVSTRAVQWTTVHEGRITRIELLFDPHPWRMLFDAED
jgi:hypothetical protein